MDEPEASRVCVQEVMVGLKVLDLFNVEESVENLEHTQWELKLDEQNTENYDVATFT